MRPSNKTAILEAAVKLADRGGITSLTLDAAAAEAGLSKGGLIYHFASKEQLLQGVIDHIITGWDRTISAELGKPYEQATDAERLAAYTRAVLSRPASCAELAILIDATHHEDMLEPWRTLVGRWVRPPRSKPSPEQVDHIVARLAADGLWLDEVTCTTTYDPEMKQAIVARVNELAQAGDGSRGDA